MGAMLTHHSQQRKITFLTHIKYKINTKLYKEKLLIYSYYLNVLDYGVRVLADHINGS